MLRLVLPVGVRTPDSVGKGALEELRCSTEATRMTRDEREALRVSLMRTDHMHTGSPSLGTAEIQNTVLTPSLLCAAAFKPETINRQSWGPARVPHGL